ncbi:MAG TPA: ABC transporter permease [Acidimicrobiia bacterium]|nr:ABC transporter permease [Acidimicrobiia bacterium]
MTATASPFTGLAPLSRFTIRRDRVRIVVWIAAIVLLVVVTVASVKGLYPNQEELDKAARASEDNVAAIIFNGPPQALDTVGGQVAFQTGTWGLILIGMMSIFMLGRLTRGEEEAGRNELLRSLPIGAHSLPGAALLTVGAMNVVTGALVTIVLLALSLPATGSVVFGLSFTMFGLLLAAVTLVAAQITENTRVVYGLGGVVLGASFVLRAIGDIGDGTVSWLSPIGWAQKTRPYAGENWWPFLLIAVATGALAWVAGVLSRHRDLGSGLIAPRTGRARAAPSLGTPLGLATRVQRGSLLGWSAGLLFLAVAYGSITDSIDQFVEDNDALNDIIAAQGNGTLVEQYLAMSFRILALIAAGFAIQSALRVRSEETAMHAEPVLATPVSRNRFAGAHLAIAFGGTLVVLLLVGLSFGIADAAVTGDADAIWTSIVGACVYAPAVWTMIGLVVAAIGLAPRLSAWPWGVLGICFVIGMFGQLLDLPTWVEDLSPFQHVPQYPANELDIVPLVVLVAIAAGLTAVGLAGLRRRDIG